MGSRIKSSSASTIVRKVSYQKSKYCAVLLYVKKQREQQMINPFPNDKFWTRPN